MTNPTIYAFFKRDINDAGTEERFTKGTVRSIGAGVFGNYEAADIVRAATEEEIKAMTAAEPSATASDAKTKAAKGA